LIRMVKIDGVRGINLSGNCTGRSLKEFDNPFVGECFSRPEFLGVDGELVLGSWQAPRLCSDTTGFVNRQTAKAGKPTESSEFVWYAFDYLHPDVIHLPFIERLDALAIAHSKWLCGHAVRLVPWRIINNMEELEAFDAWCLEQGFEGSIYRNPNGMHKSGRCSNKVTKKNPGNVYLRLKRFIDFEGVIVEIVEAMENTNEATINELGRSERSTHQENLVPKGMLGMLKKRVLEDVVHNDVVLIKKDQIIGVGPGNMDHADRVKFFQQPELLLGNIGKSKFFPHGQKDLPRFPTFIGLRAEEDMS
jgi:DNA ligase-1